MLEDIAAKIYREFSAGQVSHLMNDTFLSLLHKAHVTL